MYTLIINLKSFDSFFLDKIEKYLNSIFSFAIYLLTFLILKNFTYQKTLIIGLGLLGGSIAKSFRKYNISQNVL